MARAVASLLALTLFAACGGADPASQRTEAPSSPPGSSHGSHRAAATAAAAPANAPPQPQSQSHQRMVALLAEAAAQAKVDNPFFGERRLQRLRAEVDRLGEAAPWRLRWEAGTAALELGLEAEAIERLADTRQRLLDGRLQADTAAKVGVCYHLGVAWLRRGETENCCVNPTEETCILPIRGDGVHARRAGSEHAIEHLTEVLRNTPPDDYWHHNARWLLNLAHMTLGTFPDGVPAEHRLPAKAFTPEGPFPRFRNLAPIAGLDVEGTAGGIAVEDFDGDELLDVAMSDWAPTGQLRVFRHDRNGHFTDVTDAAGLRGITGGLNLVHADVDDDGDVDLLVLRGGWWHEAGRLPCSLLQNDGKGRFTDVTFAVGLADRREPTQTAAFADYDRDGDLDLYVGGEASPRVPCRCHLYRRDGGRYVDVTDAAGVANGRYAKGVAWGDVDGDCDLDLYVSNMGGDNRLYENRGDGTFTDVAARAGVTKPTNSFPTWFWDVDNDGALDLFVANYDTGVAHLASWLVGGALRFDVARCYRGDGKGGFADATAALGLAQPMMPMGSATGDLDNDGWIDAYVGTGDPQYASLMPNVVLRNDGGRRLQDRTMASGMGHLQKGHGVAIADIDHDGDQDVLEVVGGAYPGDAFRNALFENPGDGNHWVTLRLVGVASPRCALGARVTVVVRDGGGERRICRQVDQGGSFAGNPPRLTIGLGAATAIVAVEVRWPTSGAVQRVEGVPLDAAVRIVEGEPRPVLLPLPRLPIRRG